MEVKWSGNLATPPVLLLFSQRWRHHQPVRVALEVFKVIIQDQLKHTREVMERSGLTKCGQGTVVHYCPWWVTSVA